MPAAQTVPTAVQATDEQMTAPPYDANLRHPAFSSLAQKDGRLVIQ